MEMNKDIADLQAAEQKRHKDKKYILCYHNLTVKNCKKAVVEIRKIAEAAGSPISIAVVPSVGGVPESEIEYFHEELEKFVNEGYEILLHGARHRADLFINRNFIGRAALWLSNNGAEFAGLNERFSQALLNRSLALWNANGSGQPTGFIPPVWFANKHLKSQALEQLDYYEDLCRIYKKTDISFTSLKSKVLTFSVIPQFLLGIAQSVACLTMLLPGGTPRLVIHNSDFQTIGEKRLLNMVRYASSLREKIMYRDL
ncbi:MULTISPECIES: DUF2334 domain-containing protein [unclassified Fibrobacter]|uniref:DUF2334 domain-containing protein n=1 Tax=unclassified Fibrobacter TaxID=2634177 RepID=UPI000D6D7D35|nr:MULTISPECIES: DUF2334 domain-containing protein [unclassified Fibrobacter]PWJ60700.1 hypothetical protein BGX12_13712 [Fibrobacter sp. UWR4]PZW63904.1 hypothetical protein C8E88_103913 [Fibrobacter sp. UWR1]